MNAGLSMPLCAERLCVGFEWMCWAIDHIIILLPELENTPY